MASRVGASARSMSRAVLCGARARERGTITRDVRLERGPIRGTWGYGPGGCAEHAVRSGPERRKGNRFGSLFGGAQVGYIIFVGGGGGGGA